MDSEIENIELFDRYLNNQMPEDERLLFESRLAVDTNFNDDFITYKKVDAGLKRIAKNLNLKQELINADRSRAVLTKRSKIIRLVSISMAASILLAIGIVTIFSQSSEEKLFSNHYVKDVGLPVYMGEGQDITLANAMSQYKASEYNEALKGFEQLDSDTSRFYSALCYIELKKYDSATALLMPLQESNSYTIAQKSKYYLLLLNIREGDFKEAKILYNKITSIANFIYKDEVERLKKDKDFVRFINK